MSETNRGVVVMSLSSPFETHNTPLLGGLSINFAKILNKAANSRGVKCDEFCVN